MALDKDVDLNWSELLLFRALYPILAMSLIVRFFQDRAFTEQARRWLLFPYLLYLTSIVLSCLYTSAHHALDPTSITSFWSALLIQLLFLFTAGHIQTRKDFSRFTAVTVIAALALSGWIAWNITHMDFADLVATRGGVTVNQNYISFFVLVGAIGLLHALFRCEGFWNKTALFVLLSLILAASLLLASRGALIAFAAATLVMAPRLIPGKAAKGSLIIAAFFTLVVLSSVTIISGRNQSDVGALNGRANLWAQAIDGWANSGILHMVFGFGYNSASVILSKESDLLWNYHNEYLNSLMDSGIVGLGLYLSFLLSIWRKLNKSQHPMQNIMRGWLVFIFIFGFSGVFSGLHIYWLLLGASAGALAAEEAPSIVAPTSIRRLYANWRNAMSQAAREGHKSLA